MEWPPAVESDGPTATPALPFDFSRHGMRGSFKTLVLLQRIVAVIVTT